MTQRLSPVLLLAGAVILLTMSPPRLPVLAAGQKAATRPASTPAKASAAATGPQERAVPRPVAAPVVARTILALWDSRYVVAPRDTPVHRLAEMPLNHLGLVVRYHDIRSGLPAPSSLTGVRGVLTWYTSESLPDPQAYLRWLDATVRAGVPVVVIGSLGAMRNDDGEATPLEAINRVVSQIGWRYEPRWMTTTTGVRYRTARKELVTFERPLPTVVPAYAVTRATGEGRSLLHLAHPSGPDSSADAVVIGPRGAFVAPGFAYYGDSAGEREFRQWYIDPFEFFRLAYHTDEVPKADTATLSGRRIYYSHIDGDGWRNLTQIEPYRRRYVIAARVVLDEVIHTSSDLPVSVGAIAADLDPAWAGTAESLAVAREIFRQPQVEAAIHTYSHPLAWSFFDANGRRQTPGPAGYDGPELIGPDVLHYAKGQEPRSYRTKPFDVGLEVTGAAAFVTTLLPPGKRVMLLQWPGDTRPFARAIALTREAGLANINGGDTRFDREFPSAAWVAPLAIEIDGELQVYASNSNENTYTDLWRGRYFGFSFLRKTIENTGAPRRLKPFNLYYHMYSGERLSSLNAVRENLAFARTQALTPIETSRYSRIVQGFFRVVFEPAGPRAWRVRQRGALQTLRFDDTGVSVDFERSRGVIGQRHDLGSLYVALDESVEVPLVALKPTTTAGREPQERRPYLVESSWRVHDVRANGNGFSFTADGYGRGDSRWQWPHGTAAEIAWRASSGRSGRVVAVLDGDGLLDINLPSMSGDRVDVTVTPGSAHVAH